MIVKKNQAALYDYLDLLFTLPAHPADQEVWQTVGPTTEKGHGRMETRTLTCGNAHIEDVDWPDVQQVVRRQCERIILTTGKRTRKEPCGHTSLIATHVPMEYTGATRAIDAQCNHSRSGKSGRSAGVRTYRAVSARPQTRVASLAEYPRPELNWLGLLFRNHHDTFRFCL